MLLVAIILITIMLIESFELCNTVNIRLLEARVCDLNKLDFFSQFLH